MGDGPRDWSPRGYWDDTSSGRGTHPSWGSSTTVAVRSRRSWLSLLSLLFGSAAFFTMLFAPGTMSRAGFVWTTAGLTAVYFGIHHFSRHRRGLARGVLMASLGITFGAAATLLSIWGMLSYSYPTLPTPPHIALGQPPPPPASPSSDPTLDAVPTPAAEDDHSYEMRAGRVVPPAPNAHEVEPAYQLQANLVAAAYEICVGISQYREQYGAVPDSLTVGDDGAISIAGVTFSAVLPAYMRMSFTPGAPDESAFLTLADAQSGMAVSCVRSSNGFWIANN